MPASPMFHANAWGLPYAAALAGASLVLPGRFLQGEPLARLIERERVSVSGAVPTILSDLLRYADAHRPDLSSLRRVLCGGAAVPRTLMQGFEDRHGVTVLQVGHDRVHRGRGGQFGQPSTGQPGNVERYRG